MLQVSVYRYNPEKDAAPFMQDFQIDTNGKDIMVLDVLASRNRNRVSPIVVPAVKACAAPTA